MNRGADMTMPGNKVKLDRIPADIYPVIQIRCLLASGVDISATATELDAHRPLPDYLALRRALCPPPRIVDTRTVARSSNPLVKLVDRWFGTPWAVALIALWRARGSQAVIATGEDIGLKLALLTRIVRGRTPIILTCHNIATRRPAFYLGRLKVGSAVARFQCLSRAQADILAGRYGIGHGRIQVIYWHVDHDFFRPDPAVPLKDQICSAGTASRDYATLIEATRDIEVDVKIAADSAWFPQALNISHDTLPQRVEARSYGTYEALRRLYAESLFVVVPLYDVPFSAGYTVILEAMAMGKAVVVSRIAQRDDFVVDGWNGFYVTPGDVEGLRERIRYLLAHPDEARRLGANGRAMVEERFTLADYVRRMEEAVRDVAALTPNPRLTGPSTAAGVGTRAP